VSNFINYLSRNAQSLLGNPIRVASDVLEREDAPLYVWRQLGLTHEKLFNFDREAWETMSPAAHFYALDKQELEMVKGCIDTAYIELYNALGGVGSSLWYIRKLADGYHLFSNSSDCGSIDTHSGMVKEVTNADEALINLVLKFMQSFPHMAELAETIVLPFGCSREDVWLMARKVVLLGKSETEDFVKNTVGGLESGRYCPKISMRW
jgi:hypothetical protein